MDIFKMNDRELLDIAKKSKSGAELTKLVDEPDVSKKVRLEVAKRKDAAAYRAKLALTDKMYTEEDILWLLIADVNENVSERAFTALCNRMTWTSAGIKDKDVRDDFIEYVIEVAEKTKMSDYRISKHLVEQCIKFSKHPIILEALNKMLEIKKGHVKAYADKHKKLFESDLLESSYLQLAQQTTSVSQLQKLTESQFESVREVAKSRSLNAGDDLNESIKWEWSLDSRKILKQSLNILESLSFGDLNKELLKHKKEDPEYTSKVIQYLNDTYEILEFYKRKMIEEVKQAHDDIFG